MKSWIALWIGLFAVAVAAQPTSALSAADLSSVSQEEAAVYEAMLASWLGKEQGRQLVNERLTAPPSQDDAQVKECTKGLDFPPVAPAGVTRKSLAGVRFKRGGIELIDGSQWKPADPEDAMANGKSVNAAVDEGFSKSLISFSQIAFSRNGEEALVEFSMVCGSLCGSGITAYLHKSATGWNVVNRCGNWIS